MVLIELPHQAINSYCRPDAFAIFPDARANQPAVGPVPERVFLNLRSKNRLQHIWCTSRLLEVTLGKDDENLGGLMTRRVDVQMNSESDERRILYRLRLFQSREC